MVLKEEYYWWKSNMKLSCLFLTFFLLSAIGREASAFEYIQRFHNEKVTTKLGETIKLQWKYNLNQESKNEELLMFMCGYRVKGYLGKQLPTVPIAIANDKGEFFPITDTAKVAALKNKDMIKQQDELDLGKRIKVYIKDGRYTVEVHKIHEKMESITEFLCGLFYSKAGQKVRKIGGITKFSISDMKSPTSAASKSKKQRIRPIVYLGALLFDVILAAVVLIAYLVLNRRAKGYKPVSVGMKKKNPEKRKKERHAK